MTKQEQCCGARDSDSGCCPFPIEQNKQENQ